METKPSINELSELRGENSESHRKDRMDTVLMTDYRRIELFREKTEVISYKVEQIIISGKIE